MSERFLGEFSHNWFGSFCRYLVEPTAPDASKINPVEKKISTTSNYYESVDDVPRKSPGYQVTIYLKIKNI